MVKAAYKPRKKRCRRGHATAVHARWNGRSWSCGKCASINGKKGRLRRKQSDPFEYYLAQLRRNAKRRGLSFSITRKDLMPFPIYCPVLGIKLDYSGIAGGPVPNAASVDRTKSHLGYVRGNVQVMSSRANMLKNNATADELLLVWRYVRDTQN